MIHHKITPSSFGVRLRSLAQRSAAALAFAALLLATTACEKPKTGNDTFRFAATIEAPASDDAKTYLINEQWIYWEPYDEISIGSDQTGSEVYDAYLVSASGEWVDPQGFNGVFVSELPYNSKYFLGLYPRNAGNTITGKSTGTAEFENVSIMLPDHQGLRDDLSFAKDVFPMVAWYGGEWDENAGSAFNLDFHSLAGIVRLQLFDASNTPGKKIKKIELSSTKQSLSGKFKVEGYKTFAPYLVADPSAAKTLTLDCGDGREFSLDTICTFYVVLPALQRVADSNNATTYELTMTVYDENDNTFVQRFNAPVRRSGITNLRAIGIKNWTSPVSPEVGLAGNGTKERPFKVYSEADLLYLRDCYNSSKSVRTINNVAITKNTYIRIMRSDIEISSSNWTEGIRHFVGHISNVSSAGTPGITTSSSRPLFESVDADGVVDGLTLKIHGTLSTLGLYNDEVVCPFCWENSGTLVDCRVIGTAAGDEIRSTNNIAGICASNRGTIEGCRSGVNIEAHGLVGRVGTVCYSNAAAGRVVGCQLTSEFTVGGTEVGGIVYSNAGTVEDCYFASPVTGVNSHWGGIVYSQTGGTVSNCYVANAISSTGHVGGIVGEMTGGTVDYCRSLAVLEGSEVGAIAYSVNGSSCLIVNCYNNSPFSQVRLQTTTATNAAGGLVARLLNGTIENSFVQFTHVQRHNTIGITGGLVGVVGANGKMKNCYVYESSASPRTFYGTSSAPDANFDRCYLVAGTQANTVRVELANAANGAGESNELLSSLEATPFQDTWLHWKRTAGDGNFPYLER